MDNPVNWIGWLPKLAGAGVGVLLLVMLHTVVWPRLERYSWHLRGPTSFENPDTARVYAEVKQRYLADRFRDKRVATAYFGRALREPRYLQPFVTAYRAAPPAPDDADWWDELLSPFYFHTAFDGSAGTVDREALELYETLREGITTPDHRREKSRIGWLLLGVALWQLTLLIPVWSGTNQEATSRWLMSAVLVTGAGMCGLLIGILDEPRGGISGLMFGVPAALPMVIYHLLWWHLPAPGGWGAVITTGAGILGVAGVGVGVVGYLIGSAY